jgi:hypothetical protein
MEKFIIRDRGALVIRILGGVLLLIMGISWGFRYIAGQGNMDLILLIVITGGGLFTLFSGFRPERAEITMIEGGLCIKWINWFFSKRIYNLQIENIILERTDIVIKIYSRKAVKLRTGSFSSRQKEKIYTYFIRYSGANGIKLYRHL